tara:strand:+ start:13 stop:699 length:687 start_codon:yes stop_codon:yes gene_type:complete
MSNLLLIRHGQSEWNLENRFTGWVDVGLAPRGKLEACKSGELIRQQNIKIDFFFTSFQKRAIDTLDLILNTLRIKDIEVTKAWQLNERHYGSLTGLNKDEMKKTYGEKKIHEFRRSWDTCPEPLNKNNPYHPINISTYKNIPKEKIPDTESLKDTYERVLPFFKNEIQDKLETNKNILVAAHGNSIRAICKFLFKLDNNQITKLEIPTGNPLMINFNKKKKNKNLQIS